MIDPTANARHPDDGAFVWRYMDLAKFVSLLDTEALHFACVSTFDDRFEGTVPKAMFDRWQRALAVEHAQAPVDEMRGLVKKTLKVTRLQARRHAFSCWHASAAESAAMWNQYLKSGEGIAIKAMFSSLKASIVDKRDVYAGLVSYDHAIVTDLRADLLMLKRESFSHERELRLFVKKAVRSKGTPVKVDVRTLIHTVYVAPGSPDWFLKVVRSVASRYGFKNVFEVRKSDLDNSPIR